MYKPSNYEDAGPATSDKAAPHMPGEAGAWIFIIGDLTVFLLFFATYIYYRSADLELYVAGQHRLSQFFGIANTIVLLTISAFLAQSLQILRKGSRKRSMQLLMVSTLFGTMFVVIKAFEYGEKIETGITPTTDLFFTFYFMLTRIHLFHVGVGIGILTLMAFHIRNKEPSQTNMILLESGATFWHMVDIVWIILFPLLYLII